MFINYTIDEININDILKREDVKNNRIEDKYIVNSYIIKNTRVLFL